MLYSSELKYFNKIKFRKTKIKKGGKEGLTSQTICPPKKMKKPKMPETAKILTELQVGQTARVSDILSIGSMRRRLQDLGIIEGTDIECLHKSPSGDPVAYLIRGAAIALRSEDSCNICVQ